MFKSKFLYIVSLYVTIVLLIIAFVSCENENPIINNDYQLDSARFDWQATEMYHFTNGERCNSFWSPDTNEVFMCSSSDYLVHFKDGQLTKMNYGANIHMYSIDGLSPTEGYIIGIESKNSKDNPHIERWNGSSFTNVPINYNFEKDFIVNDIFIKSSTEIWISSPNGIVYKFDGNNLIPYYFQDTLMYSRGFLYDENNRLRYLTEYINSAIDTLQRNYVYEFDGQNWTKVFSDIFPIYHRWYEIINNFISAYEYPTTIYKLQGNILIPVLNMPNSAGISGVCGRSLNNLMGFGFTDGYQSFFHWNGQKWSNEKVGNEAADDWVRMKMINDNYVCAIKYGQIPKAYLYRGFRKH